MNELVSFPGTEDYCSKSVTSYYSDPLHTEKVNFSALILDLSVRLHCQQNTSLKTGICFSLLCGVMERD